MMPANSSPVVGGVMVMAFAPARMVSKMLSSVGPPVAMMAACGYCSRMWRTMLAVSAAPETLKISVPASMRPLMSYRSDTTVAMTGISTTDLISAMTSFGIGALTTTP